jgi:cytidine deaminase
VVLGRATAEGVAELTQIVAVGDHDRGVVSPCGGCRQILHDLFPGIRAILRAGPSVQAVAIHELLPWAYGWDPESGSTPFQE